MIREYGKGSRLIGGFWSGVFHEQYESAPGVFDLRQELYQRQDGSFYLVQKWPYDFSGGRETISEVSVWELPMVLSVLEGPIGEKIRGLEIEKMAVLFEAGCTLDEIARRLNTSPANVRSRTLILKGILTGDTSLLAGH